MIKSINVRGISCIQSLDGPVLYNPLSIPKERYKPTMTALIYKCSKHVFTILSKNVSGLQHFANIRMGIIHTHERCNNV